MGAKYSHFLQWSADEKYTSLEQTNVRISGNIKCIICSNGKIGFETIDSTPDLASLEYKGFVANKEQGYLTNLAIFANKIKNLNQLYSTINVWTSTTKFVEQLNTIYNYGAYKQQNDLFNANGLRFFAPIWTYGTLPDRFIVLRVSTNNIDHDALANQGEIVTSFDLREKTETGKFLRTLLNSNEFRKSCCEFDPELGYGWTGIDPFAGNLHTAYEHNVESYLANERTLLEQDNAITNGWMRNNLICANLLNLEFSFIDTSAKNGFNTYIGLYVNDTPIDMDILEYEDPNSGAIISKYNAKTLIVSENLETIKRYVPPIDLRNTTNLQNQNLPLEDSIENLGSTKHLIDTEFEVPDPLCWMKFNSLPVVDDKIQVLQNGEILFDYTIQKSDIKATIEQTLSSIASNISLSDVNDIGLYAEYWKNMLILYFPMFENEKTNYDIVVPPSAKLNKTKIKNRTIFDPFVHDVKTTSYLNGADSFILDDITINIEDAFEMYDGTWFIRTSNGDQELIDKHNILVFYKHIPAEFKILVPISHSRFQIENSDAHSYAMVPIIASFKENIAKTLFAEHYWNESAYTELISKYSDDIIEFGYIPIERVFAEKALFSKEFNESLDAINAIIENGKNSSTPEFIESLNTASGEPETFIANPYDRFLENDVTISRNLNKTFPFILRMANPFGNDATMLHYYNNIALQYGLKNFVPILKKYRDFASYTHDWFLLEGNNDKNTSVEALRYYKIINSNCYISKVLTKELAYFTPAQYFFTQNGHHFVFDENGLYEHEYGLRYRKPNLSEDLSSMTLCIKNDSSKQFEIPIGYDYAKAFKDGIIDAYNGMMHDIDIDEQTTNSIEFHKTEHSWVEMQQLPGHPNMFSAFFMGIEYTFEGNYSGYRFAVLLVSSTKNDKQFEIIENKIFKTLTLLIYAYIPDSLITTFGGKLPYTLDRAILYFSNKNNISSTDSSISLDSMFATPISFSFADNENEKTFNGEVKKIKLVPQNVSHLFGEEQQSIEFCPFFTIDSSPDAYVIENSNDGPIKTPASNVPLFCVFSKNLQINGDLRESVKPMTSFSWFFIVSIKNRDTVKQYRAIKITAQRIHSVFETYFWCEDITLELYPDGTPSIQDKNVPLYTLIVEDEEKLKDHAFYNELIKVGNYDQCVLYEGMFQVNVETSNSVHVRSLANEWWMRISESLDLDDPTNSWLKPFEYVHTNGERYITFNPQMIQNLVVDRNVPGAYLQNLRYDLFAHNNLWYMCDKLSITCANTTNSIASSVNSRYEAISFANMNELFKNSLIPFTRIYKELDGGIIEQNYKKQLNVSENILTFIISSLALDKETNTIIRKKYDNFTLYRYKFDYAPIFERLAITSSDLLNLEQNMVLPKKRKKYVRQVSIYDEELYPIFDDLTLYMDDKPYYAKWNGTVYSIPFAMSPTQIQNIVSKLFVYDNIFTINVEVENGKANIINALFDIINNIIFTEKMNIDLEMMSPEEITAACKPDVRDILPENVNVYDHKMIAFERFYRDTFSKQYKCTKLVTSDGKELDFVLDDQILQMVDTTYSGNISLTFKQN